MDHDKTPLIKLILQFEAFNRSEGKTLKTVEWYENSLAQITDYLDANGIEPILGSIDIGLARDYIPYLRKRHVFENHPIAPRKERLLSPVTVQNYVRALRAFCNWLYREGYTEENRLERLKLLRPD